MNRIYNFLPTTLLALVSVCAIAAEPLVDGPYVFHPTDAKQASEAIWVCAGVVKSVQLRAGAKLAAPCGSVSGFAISAEHAVAPDLLPAPAQWAAISDIHGQHGLFVQLLRAHKIINEKNQWTFGKNVLVIAGDVFDRGPQQTEALWLIYQLEQEAKAAGGSVQMVLGNHESMVMRGDLRYLHPKYPEVATLLKRRFAELYGMDTELGQWLRTRATVLKMGDTLFLHGGLSPNVKSQAPDLIALNRKIRQRVGDTRDALRDDAQATWLFAGDGPLWYRGYFNMPRATSAQIDELLNQFAVKRIVVGHTTREQIVSLYGGRVIGIDASLKDGVRGELLLWHNNQLQRGLLDGTKLPLAAGDDDGSAKLPASKND